jgi:hypothetical protein
MSGDDAFFQELESAILRELEAVETLRKEARAELRKEAANPRVLGSVLHDFYTCCERIFKRIVSEVNGGFYQGDAWHKELLYRVTVRVPGLRPAVISESLAAELDEYLSFRHIFRNIYGFELKGDRVGRLSRGLDDIGRRFDEEIRGFLDALRTQGNEQ